MRVALASLLVGLTVLFHCSLADEDDEKDLGDPIIHKAKGKEWLDEVEKQPGVHKLKNGILFKYIKKGKGKKTAQLDEQLKVHVESWLYDGTLIDTSREKLDKRDSGERDMKGNEAHVKGQKQILMMMRRGDIIEFYLPAKLAYGKRGTKQVPGNAPMKFRMELLQLRGQGYPWERTQENLEKQLGMKYEDM